MNHESTIDILYLMDVLTQLLAFHLSPRRQDSVAAP
jgi:hypothetical protein